jgi:hypothetical protein
MTMETKSVQEQQSVALQLQELLAQRDKLLAELSIDRPAQTSGRQARQGKWQAVIYDQTGAIQMQVVNGKAKELAQTFDKSQQADQWAYNKLAKTAPGWYAEVSLSGSKTCTTIDRDTAIDMIYGNHRPFPVTHTKSGRFGTMGFGVKAHQTRVEFSRG